MLRFGNNATFALGEAHVLRVMRPTVSRAEVQQEIDGQAEVGNVLLRAGEPVLIDFERAATGPREWDLIDTAVTVARFGLAEQRYRDFADGGAAFWSATLLTPSRGSDRRTALLGLGRRRWCCSR